MVSLGFKPIPKTQGRKLKEWKGEAKTKVESSGLSEEEEREQELKTEQLTESCPLWVEIKLPCMSIKQQKSKSYINDIFV